MYRCHDQFGKQVLTDNPAQLTNCLQLESSIASTPARSLPTPHNHSAPPPSPIPQDLTIDNDRQITSESKLATKHTTDISIPLRKIGGSFVVQAKLNKERTAQLIVDTGASMTVLSTDIAIDIGILGTTDNKLLTVNTAGGSVQVNVNFLTSLAVGEAQAQNIAVAIHDLPDIPEQIEGLLGMSFLKHFLVTLDAENSRLILRPRPTS